MKSLKIKLLIINSLLFLYPPFLLHSNDMNEVSLIGYQVVDSVHTIEKVVSCNLNNDMYEDLLVMTSSSEVYFLPGDVEGINPDNKLTIIDSTGMVSIFVGDWNGDLQEDIIGQSIRFVGENSITRDVLKIYLMDSVNIMDTVTFRIPEDINPLEMVSITDFDLDGKTELIFGDWAEVLIAWNESDNQVNFQYVTQNGINAYTVLTFDYNQDGYPDLFYWDGISGQPVIQENNKDKSFTKKMVGLPSVTWGDEIGTYGRLYSFWLNDDYYPDLLLHRTDRYEYETKEYYEIYIYDVHSNSYVYSDFQIEAEGSHGLIKPIHFNNDGYVDFIEMIKPFTIWMNNENSYLTENQSGLNNEYIALRNLLLFDMDNDEDLDIIFNYRHGDTLYQIVNNEIVNNVNPSAPIFENVSTINNQVIAEWSPSSDDNSITGHINYKVTVKSAEHLNIAYTHNNTIDFNSLPFGSYSLQIQANDLLNSFSALSEVEYFDIVSGLNDKEIIKNTHQLFQNYPNPFNPKTKIEYYITSPSNVTLKVYDITGQEVRILLNKYQSLGRHTVNFDASDLASGIYIYKLFVGPEEFSRKLLLLR